MTTLKNPSEVSKFYLACRNGDVEFVKNHLKTLSPTIWNPNQFESGVNSTLLHAASYYGHTEIVKLLIEYGCDRSQTNSYGLTACEEAANDEIRQLFERPSDTRTGYRFHDETTEDCFDFVKRDKRFVSIRFVYFLGFIYKKLCLRHEKLVFDVRVKMMILKTYRVRQIVILNYIFRLKNQPCLLLTHVLK